MKLNKTINIFGILKAMTVDGILALAQQIWDEREGMRQTDINDRTIVRDAEGGVHQNPLRLIKSDKWLYAIEDSAHNLLLGISKDAEVWYAKGMSDETRTKFADIAARLKELDGWQVTEDPKYMFLITDKKRNRVFGITHDGTVEYDKGMSKEVRDRLAELRGWHYEVNEEYIFAITDKKRNLFLGIKRKNGRVVTPHGVVEVMDWQEYENTEVEAGVVYVIQGTDGCVEGCYIGGKPLRTGEEYAYFTEGNVLKYNGRLTSTPKIHVDYETMRLMIEYPVGYEGPVFEVIDGILFAR